MVAQLANSEPGDKKYYHYTKAFDLGSLPPGEGLGNLKNNLSILLTIYDAIPMERGDSDCNLRRKWQGEQRVIERAIRIDFRPRRCHLRFDVAAISLNDALFSLRRDVHLYCVNS